MEKKAKPVAELKSRGDEMEYGANRVSKRAARRTAALFRMFDAKRATKTALAKLKRDAKNPLNLTNKPLGA